MSRTNNIYGSLLHQKFIAISLPKSHINLVFDNAITVINNVIKYT